MNTATALLSQQKVSVGGDNGITLEQGGTVYVCKAPENYYLSGYINDGSGVANIVFIQIASGSVYAKNVSQTPITFNSTLIFEHKRD